MEGREALEVGLTTVLADARRGGRDAVTYMPPSVAELTAFRAWLRGALTELEADRLPREAPPGFVMEPIRGTVVLREANAKRRGAGAYVFRRGALANATVHHAAPIAIHAPHTFFDTGTLPVAITAFAATDARALAINTVHRYAEQIRKGATEGGGDDDGTASPSDLAHQAGTYFQAVHEALAARSVTTIQLHGFRDDAAPGHAAIVSAAGTGFDVAPHVDGLKASLSRSIAAYPRDVRKLGGTTNEQARHSLARGVRFFHVELSKSLREELSRDEAARLRFATELVRTARGE